MYPTRPVMADSDQNGSMLDGCNTISAIIRTVPETAAINIRFDDTRTVMCCPYLCARREAALQADHAPAVGSHLSPAIGASVCLEIS